MVPLFRCDDLGAAIAFYTSVLGFELLDPEAGPDDLLVLLARGGAELMLTRLPEQPAGVAAHVLVDDVDALHALFVSRGLDQSHRPESPVHLAPVDQTWGTRELYVTDPAGNTLRFVQRRS